MLQDCPCEQGTAGEVGGDYASETFQMSGVKIAADDRKILFGWYVQTVHCYHLHVPAMIKYRSPLARCLLVGHCEEAYLLHLATLIRPRTGLLLQIALAGCCSRTGH